MPTRVIGIGQQKGGVGKSTTARMIGVAFAEAKWRVIIGDLDPKQKTSSNWNSIRITKKLKPKLAAQTIAKPQDLTDTRDYDMVILDGPAMSSVLIEQIAKASHFTFLPTGASLDDLLPACNLGHELVKKGVDRSKFAFLLNRVATDKEAEAARDYIAGAGHRCLPGYIRELQSFRIAMDGGHAIQECRFFNDRGDELLRAMVEAING